MLTKRLPAANVEKSNISIQKSLPSPPEPRDIITI
jgi:hypothetical protein